MISNLVLVFAVADFESDIRFLKFKIGVVVCYGSGFQNSKLF